MTMEIQKAPGTMALHAAESGKVGTFAGRIMSALPTSLSQTPLSARLQHSVTLNKLQELALQRLQQGEHTPLAERRIRVL
jgi:hypothetical protein